MKRFLLDSGIANLYIADNPIIQSRSAIEVQLGHRIGIGSPILGELVYGIELSKSRDRNHAELQNALQDWTIWPFDKKAAIEFGRLRAQLEQVGRKMQNIDIQLAAIAFTIRDCTVVTMDSDFAAIPGLSIENWMTP